jgi:hypothetical protein
MTFFVSRSWLCLISSSVVFFSADQELFGCAASIRNVGQFSGSGSAKSAVAESRFATDLQITRSIAGQNGESLNQIVEGWLTQKMVGFKLSDAHSEVPRVLKSGGILESNGAKLQVSKFSNSQGERATSILLMHEDGRITGRTWYTEIIILTPRNGSVTLRTKLYTQDSNGAERAPQPAISTPRFIHEVVNKLSPSSGGVPVSERALEIGHADLGRFLSVLQDADRSLPIVYVSRHPVRGLSINPNLLAEKLKGKAIVFFEETPLADAMSYYIPRTMTTFGGAIRVYRPLGDPQDAGRPVLHPYWSDHDMEFNFDRSLQGIERAVIQSFYGRSVGRSDDTPNRLSEIFGISDLHTYFNPKPESSTSPSTVPQREIQSPQRPTLRATVISPPASRDATPPLPQPSPVEVSPSVDGEPVVQTAEISEAEQRLLQANAEIATLKDRLHELTHDRDELEKVLQEEMDRGRRRDDEVDQIINEWSEELGRSQEELARSRQRILELQEENNALRRQHSAQGSSGQTPATASAPRTVRESLELAVKSNSTRIIATDRALKTAEREFADFGEVEKATQMFQSIADHLWEAYFGETRGGNIRQNFRERSGFDVALHESSTTKGTERLMKLRDDTYDGKTIRAEAHVKWGNQPGNQIRVHYDVDHERKLIVISAVVDHFPVSSSNRAGNRR